MMKWHTLLFINCLPSVRTAIVRYEKTSLQIGCIFTLLRMTQFLRPGQATKKMWPTDNCFLGRTQNGLQLAKSKNIRQTALKIIISSSEPPFPPSAAQNPNGFSVFL